MSTTVCLSASTLYQPQAAGHFWVYLNWALGLRAAGVDVIWLEPLRPARPGVGEHHRARAELVSALAARLEPYGFADRLALWMMDGAPLPLELTVGRLNLDATAGQTDVLLNFHYAMPPGVLARFRRSALVDIDPGLLQVWIAESQLYVPPHDVYFTTGETVGQPGTRIPDAGIEWHYSPPCVALDCWPVTPAAADAPFTTVTNWVGGEWVAVGEAAYDNDKRTGFLPYLDLPQRTHAPLELAALLGRGDRDERAALTARGWRVADPYAVAATAADYQRYIQRSRGEFSCAKPSCVRLQNAWISDRTLCYLASGKPAVVEHTGPSRYLPDDCGLLRFRKPDEAVRHLDAVSRDYERHASAARALAEEHFDAARIAARLLERAL
jgi:hypothetical protein